VNDILKYLYYKWVPNQVRWYPFLAVYYLTYRCRFRCPYCSDGSGRPYYQLPGPDAPAGEVMDILTKIRRCCGQLVITGGEPFEHADAIEILKGLPALKFKQCVLTTNGWDIEPHLAAIADAIDTLVFSIDTLDREKADSWYQMGHGALEKILSNIGNAQHFSKRYKIVISSVITPDNIPDLYEVYEYARQRGFVFAAAPQLVGVKAAARLQENQDYRRFFDFLIKEKRKKAPVFGSRLYLEYMRDLTKFRCYPFTMLVVSPTGEIFYPCLEIGNKVGNICEGHSLHRYRQEGDKHFGPQPDCDTRCHSACALSFGLLFSHLFSMVGFR